MKQKDYHFYVITWGINRNNIEKYDIIPYLLSTYKDKHKGKNGLKITSDEELKTFILSAAKYQWWCRCEYEIIVSSWPSYHDTFDYAEYTGDSVDGEYKNYKVPVNRFGENGKRKTVLDNSNKIDVYYQVEMNIDTIVDIFKNLIKYDR